jgi:all-trans-retinol 13,14-reductase
MSKTKNEYDAILIGSGMGVLSCASILTQLQKKKVLILERHFKLGGFTHTFKRKGNYEWDVGVHYVGEMQKWHIFRKIFDITTQGKVKWNRMPDKYDVFVYPGLKFNTYAGKKRFKQELIELFPNEEKGIKNYIIDLRKAVHWFYRYCVTRGIPNWLSPISKFLLKPSADIALMTVENYLNSRIHEPKLKAILASQWGTLGLPPSKCVFAIHALIVNHYINGAFYPVGGAKVIADSIIPIIESNGSKLCVNHNVTEILIKDGKAIGVKAVHKTGKEFIEKEYYSDIIISGIGADATYNRLIPQDIHLPFREECKRIAHGISCITLYLGLKESPRKLGLHGENYWLYASIDHEKNFSERNEIIQGKVSHVFLSFPSLKNPSAKAHTAEIVTFIDHEPFKQWANQPWMNRDKAYEELKNEITEALINFTNKYIKGLKELIDYKELATPLTTVSMTGHEKGYIYGLPVTPERYKLNWLGARTPIKNLYLTGVDTLVHGVVGGMLGGALTAGIVMGIPGVSKILTKIIRKV